MVSDAAIGLVHDSCSTNGCGLAVGDKTYIMYDSGVRGASDVFKALALGAKFVFVGRLWIWGLSIMGEHGVRHVMKSLLADFDILMAVAGFQNVDQITREHLGEQTSSDVPLRLFPCDVHLANASMYSRIIPAKLSAYTSGVEALRY